MWLYAIANAIESCINGTSSVRTFDATRLRTSSALDDHAVPLHTKNLGLGFPIPATPGNRRSMPPLGRHTSFNGNGDRERRIRKTSFKNVLKQGGEKWQSVVNGVTNRNSSSFDIPRPMPANLNRNSGIGHEEEGQGVAIIPGPGAGGRITPTPPNSTTPGSGITASPSSKSVLETWGHGGDSTEDTVIEKRVLEMAGLGLGSSPRSASLARRVQSEGVRHLEINNSHAGSEMSRSRSAETMPEMTMKVLRELADNPSNSRCADCKKPTKASQWATLSKSMCFAMMTKN
jgi:hypothetical protein